MFFWNVVQATILLQYFLFSTVLGATTSFGGPTASPTPISVNPSENFDGNDGPWSSFFLRVGTPPQVVSVFVSTAGNQPWVVLPQGCSTDGCVKSRGGVFKPNCSSTWVQNNVTSEGIFALAIESNLGLKGNGLYGYDTVALSYLGSNLPSLGNQVVAGIATEDFYMGVFGVNPAATNFSSFDHPVPSYMRTLKSQNMIPSLSYGYTAGNQYRFNKVLGSLTLGGYDAGIIEPNDLTIPLSSASTTDLTVEVQSITMSSRSGNQSLSSTSFPAFVDSTVPYLYLPVEVCEKFEEAFSIVYDNQTGLYLVNDTLHSQLLDQAANVTFTITNITAQVVIDIVLPYLAFDLTADYPLVPNATRYFPLKRSQNTNQNTLGRTFLQEAYVIADYERSNFSIYQRKWDANAQADIRSILPIGDSSMTGATAHSKVPVTTIVASLMSGLVLLILFLGFLIIIRQRNQKLKAIKQQSVAEPTPKPNEGSENIISPIGTVLFELDGVDTLVMAPELDARGIYEMPANEPVGSELYEYSGNGKGKTLSLRQRELEYKRNALRNAQFSRRNRFRRDDPQFMFGSISQNVSSQVVTSLSPQFKIPTWNQDQAEGGSSLPRNWSSPAISPATCKRQCSNPEGFEERLNKGGNAHEISQFSKFGSV